MSNVQTRPCEAARSRRIRNFLQMRPLRIRKPELKTKSSVQLVYMSLSRPYCPGPLQLL